MTNYEAIEILKGGYPDINTYAASEYEQYEDDVQNYEEALGLAIKTLEATKAEHKAYNEGFKDGVGQGIKLSERPQGEWVVQKLHNGFEDVYCPFCNSRPTRSEYGYYLKDNFCRECGADMRKGGAE